MDTLAVKHTHNRDQFIKFYETGHKYEILNDKEHHYTSVTTWIHSHFKKFNSDKIIKNMMSGKNWKEGHKYWGLTSRQIKTLWNENGKKESQAGTDLHARIECFMNNSTLQGDYTHKTLYNNYHDKHINDNNKNEAIEWTYFLNFIKDTPNFKPYRTEWMVYDDDLKLSGSIDMVYENENGTLSIYDWKRSKEISKINSWGDFAITPCISEMPDSNYWHYALQLNIYKRILENKYNKTVQDLFLVRLHPDAEEQNYELIKVHDLTIELDCLLNHLLKKNKIT